MQYNIVLKNNKDFVLASCKTYELAIKYLENIKKTDKFLSKYYGWKYIPTYMIIEK